MSQNTKKLKILQRGDSSANWTENNPTLRGTEVGFETNTGKYKIGIGDKNQETHWNELPYPAWGAEREIVLSGGATGKITMDGTKNVSLPVTTLQENYLQLSSSSFSGSTSVIGGSTMANFRANRMALYPESAVTFEVSTDGGTTWTEQTGPNKNKVVRQLTMSDQASVNIGTGLEASSGKATVNDQLRVTFDFLNPDGTSNILYCRMQKLFINISTYGATGAKMKMEYTLIRDPETWVTYQNYSISGWPAWNEMGFGTFGQYVGGATNTNSWRKMRLTFSITGLHNTNSSRLQFRGIMMQAQQCWSKPSTWAEYDAPYRLNMDTGSIYFPGRIDGDISKGANLSKSTGLNATHQNFDTGDTFDFTDKNPNATVLDATLTGNIVKGGRGSYSMSLGGKSAAIGKRSVAEGTTTIAKGAYSHVEGDCSVTLGDDSHAEGYRTVSKGMASHTEGANTMATNSYAHAEGNETLASGADSHAEGYQSEATGTTSHAEGNATQAIGISSHSEGSGTKASGDNSHSEGINTQALGESSHTEGNSNVAEGKNSHAEGYNNSTLGESSHIEGIGNANEAEGAHIEGWQNNATEDAKYSHINGVGLTANTYAQTVIGRWNDSSIPPGDPHILVVGGGTNENNRKNIMTLTSSGDLYCASNIRVGENREELATVNQLIGKSGSGLNSEIFNNYNYNIASGAHSHAEGCGKVENLNSHRGFLVIDRDYSSKTLTLNTTEGLEIGDNIGIGYFDPTGTRISSPSNLKIIDINNNTITISSTIATLYQLPLPLIFIFAVDKDVGSNISGGYSAHAENYGTAKGEFSHAEGFQTSAEGWSSHTEGQNSTALGVGAHSEGYYTYANTKFSHTEGHGAKTGIQGYSVISYDSTNNSFVLNTTAALKIGDIVSASDGKAIDYQYATITAIDKDNKTITVSNASKLTKITTIIGSGTRGDTFIFGQGAHAEGYYTNATSNYSHVQGQYNLNDLECKYAHIVGNGTGISARSNAHTLDWQGNAWFAGDIKVGGTGYDDANAVSIGRSNGTVVYIPFNDIYTAGYTNKWCYYKIGKIDGINSFTKKIFVNNPQKAIISGSADEYHFGTSNIFNLNEWIAVNLYQDSYYYYIKIDNDGNLYACAVYSGSSTSVSFDPTYLYIVPINTFIESPSTIPTVDYTQYILTEIENPTKVEDCLFYSTFTTNNSENIQTYYIDKKISGSVRVLIVDSNDNIIINTIANDTTTSVSTSPTKIPANTELKLYIFGSITKNSNDLRDINFGEIFYATYNNNISQNYLRSYNGITINGNYNSNGQFQNLLEDDRSNIQASDFTKYFNQ